MMKAAVLLCLALLCGCSAPRLTVVEVDGGWEAIAPRPGRYELNVTRADGTQINASVDTKVQSIFMDYLRMPVAAIQSVGFGVGAATTGD